MQNPDWTDMVLNPRHLVFDRIISKLPPRDALNLMHASPDIYGVRKVPQERYEDDPELPPLEQGLTTEERATIRERNGPPTWQLADRLAAEFVQTHSVTDDVLRYNLASYQPTKTFTVFQHKVFATKYTFDLHIFPSRMVSGLAVPGEVITVSYRTPLPLGPTESRHIMTIGMDTTDGNRRVVVDVYRAASILPPEKLMEIFLIVIGLFRRAQFLNARSVGEVENPYTKDVAFVPGSSFTANQLGDTVVYRSDGHNVTVTSFGDMFPVPLLPIGSLHQRRRKIAEAASGLRRRLQRRR